MYIEVPVIARIYVIDDRHKNLRPHTSCMKMKKIEDTRMSNIPMEISQNCFFLILELLVVESKKKNAFSLNTMLVKFAHSEVEFNINHSLIS